ncbi:hypothetical protein LOTGIDRAFT_161034 [Lottia gigantea]|uniref:Uncharacterized protein n=1 Tax=Lottia gigantea TaxID=225164 RepID=V3ZTJ2_LOTGI|nr:hypothetical protein LOTGIDRAFT_161034 [Lottia gigantea]ESO94783.1 hypothetical protein LOTGIDRAFT_161034 [Lottia gigantea]
MSVTEMKKTEKNPTTSECSTAMKDKDTSSKKAKVNFKKAVRALNKFKMAVRVVTATKRFRRGPLNTILSISQEKAMEEMIERRKKEQSHALRHLHYTECGKVATLSAVDSRAKIELVRKNSRKLKEAEKSKNEDIEKIENAFNFMTPKSLEKQL